MFLFLKVKIKLYYVAEAILYLIILLSSVQFWRCYCNCWCG